MIVQWQPEAEADLNSAVEYLEQFNSIAARRLLRNVILAADSLNEFPDRGRLGNRAGTRELTIPPYILVYRVDTLRHHVDILRLWHAAQDR